MKKVDTVPLKIQKMVKMEKLEEEISISEMKSGNKRKRNEIESNAGNGKKVQNIKTQKFEQSDFKIFGAAKNFMNRANRYDS